ncbi:MAG: aldo/keto reductase [Paracoccaceae bacterium]|nr:aldo/keto reductase [Paracoccaceae bacterium]
MERVHFSKNISFSRIIYGMWRLTEDGNISVEHITKKISLCLDQGITTFDQADIYGDYSAEETLGNAIAADKAIRNKMEIITKCDIVAPCGKFAAEPLKYYNTSKEHITQSVNSSLKNMKIDHIDMLLIHRPDPFMNADETGQVLDELIKSGKVRAAGVSNFKPWDWNLLQSRMENPLLTNQIEFSLSKHEPLTNGDLSFHYEKGVNIMAWSPLGGGRLLVEKNELYSTLKRIAYNYESDLATIALAWILSHPSRILPVVGTNNLERIRKIHMATDTKIDRASWFALYSASIGHEVP